MFSDSFGKVNTSSVQLFDKTYRYIASDFHKSLFFHFYGDLNFDKWSYDEFLRQFQIEVNRLAKEYEYSKIRLPMLSGELCLWLDSVYKFKKNEYMGFHVVGEYQNQIFAYDISNLDVGKGENDVWVRLKFTPKNLEKSSNIFFAGIYNEFSDNLDSDKIKIHNKFEEYRQKPNIEKINLIHSYLTDYITNHIQYLRQKGEKVKFPLRCIQIELTSNGFFDSKK